VLGGDAASVESDRASMKGVVRVTEGISYSVHEIQTSSGLRVREYVSADGKVFAVSWRGPGFPDLGALLGKYGERLAQAAPRPHYNHHQLNVETPDVVMQSSGHTRAYFGRVWVPALLPQNFSLSDIN
jgi:Protein of unknown function (DUF2844)